MQTSLNGDISFANLEHVSKEAGIPEVIFHLAGGSSVPHSLRIPHEDFKRTVTSTSELMDWVRANAPQTTVVLASSAAVYGTGHSKPINELAEAVPYSPYGYHKRMAEMVCESYSKNFGLKTRVVRLFSVYGPELRKQLLWDTCQKLSTGATNLLMNGSGQERRDWLHVTDCVSLLCKIAESEGPFCVVNGGTGVATSVEQIVQQLCQDWGEAISFMFTCQKRRGDPTDLVADAARAHEFGWNPSINLQDGIREYVQWFRKCVH